METVQEVVMVWSGSVGVERVIVVRRGRSGFGGGCSSGVVMK